LDARPQGHEFASALSLCTEKPTPLGDGEVRIAAEYLSMDAGTRMWMSPRTDGYQAAPAAGRQDDGGGAGPGA
jgi:NADPH-dependent curcumin reductase CurA